MSEFDRELSEALRSNGRLEPERAETLRKEAVRMFDRKLTVVKYVTWGFIVFFAVVLLLGTRQLWVSKTPKAMFFGLVAVVLGGQGQVLIKLWYWTVNTKLNLLKELKQLQLQVAELSLRKGPE